MAQALETASASPTTIWRAAAARNYNEYRKKYFALFPGAVELLRELRERGMKLGMVTNGLSETHREKIALLRIGEFFDAIFIADEVGMIKPDPLLFAHACTSLGSARRRTARWSAIATIATFAARRGRALYGLAQRSRRTASARRAAAGRNVRAHRPTCARGAVNKA